MTIFHAHHTVEGNSQNGVRGWEVDGRNANSRQGGTVWTYIRCPWDHTELGPTGYTITRMLVGHDEGRPWLWISPSDTWAFIPEIRRFVDRKFTTGYLNTGGLMPIMPADRQGIISDHGEIPAGPLSNPQFQRRLPPWNDRQQPNDMTRTPCKFPSPVDSRRELIRSCS
jgi:hypothetical protein